ncbi:MAG: peptide-methionine (S)-S-oxide reductase MsrA [SAR324 cluster bacterium]|nr:peptide-methionine (S)-S-oxide reductase MsrA [SAR324 cluster bacterium]MCZ6647008.1 peptide-methionine (S)-S-oxide reductase MsrA [SAR324 cluster bacterium]MCZ6728775.1 peptide-methionine (S)-S-oxide reductase MsrA [SAR324 cluster bacterium]MCZ6843698.1 peptide-methionine (S)-S-oxide reductase MsrA [SAR324 cluster bacterium]
MEQAIFAAGCFWGVEEAFRPVTGVKATAVGYSGGKTVDPTYEQVCTGNSGHAEVVRVEYDPSQVTYQHLLELFWNSHDPTTLNRQGPDVGTQYRSAIFFLGAEQEALALASKEAAQRSGRFEREIMTEITPASQFYMAEDYHQLYFQKRARKVFGLF